MKKKNRAMNAVNGTTLYTWSGVSTKAAEHEDWDLLAVYLETIDRIGHCFMEYHPPQLARISDEDFARYRNVVAEMYRFHDLLLGRYMDIVGPETTILLVSDHGFYSGANRPNSSPSMSRGNPLEWHRSMGTIIAAGPGIRRDELIHGSSILDIAPTILHLLGLPVPEDMEGRVLLHALEQPAVIESVPSYPRFGDDSLHVPGEDNVWEAQESIRQLVELGYIEPPSEDGVKAVRQAQLSKLSNIARVYRSKKMFVEAVATLEELLALAPENPSARVWLAVNHMSLGHFDTARGLVEDILAESPTGPWANYLYGQLMMREGNVDGALACFRNAQDIGFDNPALHFHTGAALLQKEMFADAEVAFRAAVDLQPDYADALDGLGVSLYRQGRAEAALEAPRAWMISAPRF